MLTVASISEKVTVQDSSGPALTTDSSNNASAVVLRGADLDALSDDPDDLAADLQALAGPSAGPNGGSIFVDGFSGGQLPPKESIREIRINQNPFSPEYDKLGYGKIEIFTKPGSDKYRGTAQWNFANDFWNTRNPYAPTKGAVPAERIRGERRRAAHEEVVLHDRCAAQHGGQRLHHQRGHGRSADAGDTAVRGRRSPRPAGTPTSARASITSWARTIR